MYKITKSKVNLIYQVDWVVGAIVKYTRNHYFFNILHVISQTVQLMKNLRSVTLIT